jgi:hypothetical protein
LGQDALLGNGTPESDNLGLSPGRFLEIIIEKNQGT